MIGRQLAQLRRRRGLKQRQLALRLGLTQSAIAKVEREATPRLSTLMRYAEALGADLQITLAPRAHWRRRA